jgi:hypothetical protein
MQVARAVVALVAALGCAGCFAARTDARVKPGFHLAAAAAAVWTPDAETTNPDAELRDIAETHDAARARAVGELQVAYAGSRVELRWHAPVLTWAAENDFVFEHRRLDIFYVGRIDLYVLAGQRGPWHYGFGGELGLPLGLHAAVTRELSPGTALTLTAGPKIADEAMVQAQLALVVASSHVDLAVFAGLWTVPGGDVVLRSQSYDPSMLDGASHVDARTLVLVGMSVAR